MENEKKKNIDEPENQSQEPEIKEQEQAPTTVPKKTFPNKMAIIASSAVAIVGIGAVALVGLLGNHTHSFGEWATAKEATCEVNGLKERFCSCGEKQTEDIHAYGHSFGAWTIVEEPTCGAEGNEKRECSCGEKETRSIEKHKSHDNIVIDAKIESTCKDTGLTEGKHCSVCNEVIVAQTVIEKSMNHAYTDKYDAICNICNYERDPDCAHTNKVTDPGKAATCTEDGLTDGQKCAKCGEVLIAKTTIKANGHTKGSWFTDKQATCLNEGLKHQECSVCHATVDNEITSPLGHTESGWITENESTCTIEGNKYKECTVCNEKLETKLIPKLSHNYGSYEIDIDATCTTAGSKHKNCIDCGNKSDPETITILEHVDSQWIVDKESTCTEKGSRHKYCSRCEKDYGNENTPAKGHSYTSYICTICEQPQADVKLIYNMNDLASISNNLGATYVLMNDIDCNGLSLTPIGSSETSAFIGIFDGRGYTISNFKPANAKYLGIFGYNSGTIRNLNVDNVIIEITSSANSDGSYIGGIAGYNAGKIESCKVVGNISANIGSRIIHAGLITSYNVGVIENVVSIGNLNVKGNYKTAGDDLTSGGVCGTNNGIIKNAFVNITSYIKNPHIYVYANSLTGLICGKNDSKGTIEYCVMLGTCTKGDYGTTGDVSAKNSGTVSSCYKGADVQTGSQADSVNNSDLNNSSFYEITMKWSKQDWNCSNVNIVTGNYPTLIQN